jgi:S2P endopeptidase
VVHEFGHAIAAAADEIKLETVGFNLFLIFPSAYVVLPSSDLNRSSLISRLRIFCAGAWHNIVLCIFVIAFIFLFCSPGCPVSLIENNGAFVLRVDEESPLKDRLQSRSVSIVGVGDCPTPNREAWLKCLTDLMQKSHGYCVPKDVLIHSHKQNGEECCSKIHNRQICFDVIDPHFSKEHNELKKVCLIARDVTKYEGCINECKSESSACVKPFQQVQDKTKNLQNIEHLLRIKLSNEDEIEQDRDIIYFGTIPSLYHQVQVSNFRIRWPFNIIISFNTLSLLEKLCRYIFALSSALALLNLAPVYMLDGEKVYETIFIFLSFRYRHSISPYLFRTIYNYVCAIFSALLVLNLVISMINMLQMVFRS